MTSLSAGCIDEAAHEWFVELSRDTSPLHVDAAHARRGPIGERVVHGAHLVLLMLEALGSRGLRGHAGVTVSFRNPLTIDQRFSIEWCASEEGDERTARAVADGVVLVNLTLRLGSSPWLWSPDPTMIGPEVAAMAEPAEAVAASGVETLAIDPGLLAVHAPHVDPGLAAALCAASRIAGMRCPGNLALLRGFTLAPAGMEDGLVWSTTRVRDSLRLIIIGVSGGAEGGIEVVMRHPPVQQASLQALNSLITPGEFEGVRAVVLGGTRGLGLLAARALVAGGAEVVVTGRPSGDPVDGLRCEWMDVAHPDPIILRRLHALAPTHLLHFATPPIPRRTGRAWSHELYESYIAVYEGGLALASRLASSSLRVFYPSTAFIEERPSGFDEYIAAKEASERAARDLARNSEGIAVMVERLPVLATDQTAGVANASPEFNLEVMLPILRSFAGSTG